MNKSTAVKSLTSKASLPRHSPDTDQSINSQMQATIKQLNTKQGEKQVENKLAKTDLPQSHTDTSSQITMASKNTKMQSKLRIKKQLEGKKILKKTTKSTKMVKTGSQENKRILQSQKSLISAKNLPQKTGENLKINSPENKENEKQSKEATIMIQEQRMERNERSTTNKAEPLSNRSTNSFALPMAKKQPSESNHSSHKNDETFGSRAKKVGDQVNNSERQEITKPKSPFKNYFAEPSKRPKLLPQESLIHQVMPSGDATVDNFANLNNKTKKRSWNTEEDQKLIELVQIHGPQQWNSIAEQLNQRTGKQCRERWHNQLDPSLKRQGWSNAEEWILFIL